MSPTTLGNKDAMKRDDEGTTEAPAPSSAAMGPVSDGSGPPAPAERDDSLDERQIGKVSAALRELSSMQESSCQGHKAGVGAQYYLFAVTETGKITASASSGFESNPAIMSRLKRLDAFLEQAWKANQRGWELDLCLEPPREAEQHHPSPHRSAMQPSAPGGGFSSGHLHHHHHHHPEDPRAGRPKDRSKVAREACIHLIGEVLGMGGNHRWMHLPGGDGNAREARAACLLSGEGCTCRVERNKVAPWWPDGVPSLHPKFLLLEHLQRLEQTLLGQKRIKEAISGGGGGSVQHHHHGHHQLGVEMQHAHSRNGHPPPPVPGAGGEMVVAASAAAAAAAAAAAVSRPMQAAALPPPGMSHAAAASQASYLAAAAAAVAAATGGQGGYPPHPHHAMHAAATQQQFAAMQAAVGAFPRDALAGLGVAADMVMGGGHGHGHGVTGSMQSTSHGMEHAQAGMEMAKRQKL